MTKHLRTAVRMTAISVIIFGFFYPVAIWGIGRVAFPWQSGGSYVRVDGRVVGSAFVGELWRAQRYFHGRPSAAGRAGYDPTATGGSTESRLWYCARSSRHRAS